MATDRYNFRKRLLGRALYGLRLQSGMTQEEAGEPLRLRKSVMSRIENGQLPEYNAFLALLDRYGVPSSDFQQYIVMYDRAKEKGWWHAYGLDDRAYVSAEADAAAMQTYQLGYVPGLLQTEEYMRALFTSARVPFQGTRLENEVAVRLRRQQRLTEEPVLRLHAVIDETALRRSGCDKHQLATVLAYGDQSNVTVQVIPNDTGIHSGLYGNFTILRFPHREEPPIAFVEYGFGTLEVENRGEVSAASLLFKHLVKLALSEQDSIALIERAHDDL